MKNCVGISCFLIAGVVLAASCGGLRSSGSNNTSTSNNNNKTSVSTLQPSGDAREDVRKALTALVVAKSFRAHLTNNGKSLMQIEFVAPDRFHTKSEANPEGRFSPPGEMIIIGKDTFFRADGSWRKAPPGMSIGAMVDRFRQTDVEQEMTKYTGISYVGPDSLDGSPMLIYQYRKNDKEGQQTPGRMWIGANDGQPYKFEYEGKGDSGSKMSVTYEYNADIKIELPA